MTPPGSPLRLAVTEPPNPFRAVIETVKVELELPAFAITEVGIRITLKSDAAVTVNMRFAECVKTPDVPLTVTV